MAKLFNNPAERQYVCPKLVLETTPLSSSAAALRGVVSSFRLLQTVLVIVKAVCGTRGGGGGSNKSPSLAVEVHQRAAILYTIGYSNDH